MYLQCLHRPSRNPKNQLILYVFHHCMCKCSHLSDSFLCIHQTLADSEDLQLVFSARSRRLCLPGCKCVKIGCLSRHIHSICLIMNASVRSSMSQGKGTPHTRIHTPVMETDCLVWIVQLRVGLCILRMTLSAEQSTSAPLMYQVGKKEVKGRHHRIAACNFRQIKGVQPAVSI